MTREQILCDKGLNKYAIIGAFQTECLWFGVYAAFSLLYWGSNNECMVKQIDLEMDVDDEQLDEQKLDEKQSDNVSNEKAKKKRKLKKLKVYIYISVFFI